MLEKSNEEITSCIQKQEEYCKESRYPNFAPYDGVCWSCNKNIYQNYKVRYGISDGEDGESHVTGCPHCNRSFCD